VRFPELRVADGFMDGPNDVRSGVADMKVICAWCRGEGAPEDLGETEPFEDPAPTHSICSSHQEQLLESLPSRSFPGVAVLMVVHANETALYEHLERTFAGVDHVKVIMDRRRGDRRLARQAVADERRDYERRLRGGKRFALGYTAVHFGTAASGSVQRNAPQLTGTTREAPLRA
jgi:hypothetical protein